MVSSCINTFGDASADPVIARDSALGARLVILQLSITALGTRALIESAFCVQFPRVLSLCLDPAALAGHPSAKARGKQV